MHFEIEITYKKPLHNAPFCPITASGSNFNPRNTQCIRVVEIIIFLVLGQNWTFFKGLYKKMISGKICSRSSKPFSTAGMLSF